MRLTVLLLFAVLLNSCAYYFGNRWQNSFKKIPKTDYPKFDNHPSRIEDVLSTHPIVLHWANKELVRPDKKRQRGPERLMLAKLIAGKDIDQVNNYLLESLPWGNSGTSGDLNPLGDYDFTSIILSAILHRFKNDSTILWNRTEEHLARVLLIEKGGKPHTKTPRTMAIMKDTENHILMTNISQYLKNQWLIEKGETNPEFNNLENGLEQFLLDNLEELQLTGQYEFNSKPYEGYTISALLVLHAYADSKDLKKKTEEVLDSWVWEYLQTSSDFRKSAPFRRRMGRFNSTSLTDNASTSMIEAWHLEKEKGVFKLDEIDHNHHQVLSAVVYDYRPPAEIWKEDNSERLLLIGHGRTSSPEVHSRGDGFLLSAGGFHRGEASQLVARPIVLMLDDGAIDLEDCFHINGKGKWKSWNNTGVHHRFAIGEQPVQVPSRYKPTDTLGNWALYRPSERISVVTYSEKDFGIIYLPKEQTTLNQIAELNTDPANEPFRTSDSVSIKFNLNSPKGRWIIESVDGKTLKRKTDTWKRVNVIRQ